MKLKILVTGGGSGGHIIPTLAVIDKLKELNKDIDILYVGSRGGMEAKIVPEKGLPFKGIFCGKLRRYFSWENFTDIFRVITGLFQSFYIVLTYRPSVIFAKGGYVTVPVGLAGGLLRIPLVLHESDTVLGLSNRILSRFATKLSLGFPPDNYPQSVRNKGHYTGSPINPEVMKILSSSKEEGVKHFGLDPGIPVLFVTGGSQGARAINTSVSSVMENLLEKVQVIHQAGKPDYPELSGKREKLPENLRKKYRLYDYISDDMAKALFSADLILTRGGANTLCECLILKKPTIIIPLPKAANDHQRKNGRVLVESGASIMIDQAELTPELLLKTINDIILSPCALEDMAEGAKKIAKPDAALSVAKAILGLIK